MRGWIARRTEAKGTKVTEACEWMRGWIASKACDRPKATCPASLASGARAGSITLVQPIFAKLSCFRPSLRLPRRCCVRSLCRALPHGAALSPARPGQRCCQTVCSLLCACRRCPSPKADGHSWMNNMFTFDMQLFAEAVGLYEAPCLGRFGSFRRFGGSGSYSGSGFSPFEFGDFRVCSGSSGARARASPRLGLSSLARRRRPASFDLIPLGLGLWFFPLAHPGFGPSPPTSLQPVSASGCSCATG